MSESVASHIAAKLSYYDNLVREGLRDGDVLEKVKDNFSDIVSLHSIICKYDLILKNPF
jgi:hypothetical protein